MVHRMLQGLGCSRQPPGLTRSCPVQRKRPWNCRGPTKCSNHVVSTAGFLIQSKVFFTVVDTDMAAKVPCIVGLMLFAAYSVLEVVALRTSKGKPLRECAERFAIDLYMVPERSRGGLNSQKASAPATQQPQSVKTCKCEAVGRRSSSDLQDRNAVFNSNQVPLQLQLLGSLCIVLQGQG